MGHSLQDNQLIILRVVTPLVSNSEVDTKVAEQRERSPSKNVPEPSLPEWCDVFRGLSSGDIDAIDAIICQRADFTRIKH